MPNDLAALSGLSLQKAMICWSQSSTIAPTAEGQRQHEGSSGALQRRHRPLSPVPVAALSPKAVQWSNEAPVKAVLAPFCPSVGFTPSRSHRMDFIVMQGLTWTRLVARPQRQGRRNFLPSDSCRLSWQLPLRGVMSKNPETMLAHPPCVHSFGWTASLLARPTRG